MTQKIKNKLSRVLESTCLILLPDINNILPNKLHKLTSFHLTTFYYISGTLYITAYLHLASDSFFFLIVSPQARQ